MATGILRRIMFMDMRNDQIRFMPWNLVQTAVGPCYEPRQYNIIRPAGFDSFDPTDMMAKVDELKPCDGNAEWNYLTGKGEVVHGGPQMPSIGSY